MKCTNYILLTISTVLIVMSAACNRSTSQSKTVKRIEKQESLEHPNEKDQADRALEANDGPRPEGMDAPMRNYYSNTPDTVIMMRKTACFGNCPVYKIIILSNGTMTYLGKRNVEQIGSYTSSVNIKTIRKIDEMFNEMSILKMSDHYPKDGEDIVDIPNTIIEAYFKGKKKHIFINHDAPEQLKSLITFIDQLKSNASWQAVNSKN